MATTTSTSTILIDEKVEEDRGHHHHQQRPAPNSLPVTNAVAGWLLWARDAGYKLPNSIMSFLSAPHSLAAGATATATPTATASSTANILSSPLRSSRLQQDVNVARSTPLTGARRRRPIPNSYWATPYLLACEYPWSPGSPRQKLDALLTTGVRTFIDLTEHGELLQYQTHLPSRALTLGLSQTDIHSIEYYRFPIPDRTVPPSNSNIIHQILDVIRECENEGRVAAVHCRGGIGRTGTVVGCWLVESGIARDGEEALRIIAEEWKTVEKCSRFPCSPETGPQCNFVKNYKRAVVVDGTTSTIGLTAATTTTSSSSSSSPTHTPTHTTTTTKPSLNRTLPTSNKPCVEAQVENVPSSAAAVESIW